MMPSNFCNFMLHNRKFQISNEGILYFVTFILFILILLFSSDKCFSFQGYVLLNSGKKLTGDISQCNNSEGISFWSSKESRYYTYNIKTIKRITFNYTYTDGWFWASGRWNSILLDFKNPQTEEKTETLNFESVQGGDLCFISRSKKIGNYKIKILRAAKVNSSKEKGEIGQELVREIVFVKIPELLEKESQTEKRPQASGNWGVNSEQCAKCLKLNTVDEYFACMNKNNCLAQPTNKNDLPVPQNPILPAVPNIHPQENKTSPHNIQDKHSSQPSDSPYLTTSSNKDQPPETDTDKELLQNTERKSSDITTSTQTQETQENLVGGKNTKRQ